MSTSVAGKEVRVIHGTQAARTTIQTRGMDDWGPQNRL